VVQRHLRDAKAITGLPHNLIEAHAAALAYAISSLYAVAVAMSAFLLFAGLGSRLSPRLAERCGERRAVALAVAAMVVLAAFYLAALALYALAVRLFP